jgi:phosphate uptake regulator
MLDINRHTLTLGVGGLLGTTDPTTLSDRARRSDDRVDDLAQQVRRELMVHASVRGAHTDLSTTLAAMSVVKDIQRIGDRAIGLVRLARIHGHFTPHQPQHAQLTAYRHRLNAHLAAARDALRTHDPSIAEGLTTDTIALTDELDLAIDLLVITGHDTTDPTDQTATVLAYHHLSRLAAHLTNVATAIALPLDRLDTYEGRDGLHAHDVDAAT